MSHLFLSRLLITCSLVPFASAATLNFDAVAVGTPTPYSANASVSARISLPDTDDLSVLQSAFDKLAENMLRTQGFSVHELEILLNQNINQNINVNQNVNLNQNIITINLLFGGDVGGSQAAGSPVGAAGLTGVGVGLGPDTIPIPVSVGSSTQFVSFNASGLNIVGITSTSSVGASYTLDTESIPEPAPLALVIPTLLAMVAIHRRLRVR